MIQLQRASAGSGKTFTLARKFIGYLFSYCPNGANSPMRLCKTPGEILTALRRILAITFTNMATTEMKERIVEKLAGLGSATASTPPDSIDYLADLMKQFDAGQEEIARTARMAIDVVLNNFGDFNVSTIDSFFQSVLRTFAYETNLTDSYQVEMDADLLASVAIDSSLDEINAGGNPPVKYWTERLMDKRRESGGHWNVFARSSNPRALYQEFLNTAKKTENETYKQNRNALEQYFRKLEESGQTFRELYIKLESANETPVREAHARMVAAAKDFSATFLSAPSEIEFGKFPPQHAAKILDSHPFENKDKSLFSLSKLEEKLDNRTFTLAAAKRKKALASHGEIVEKIEDAAAAMYTAWATWCEEKTKPRFLLWLLYRDNLMYLALLHEIRRNVTKYLQENGLVELSDTGVILNQIIGDSDVSFIYERLGTRLSHYLIDEFQDTSTLQWENMKPLLGESLGRGEESLVIGDAKQSIYRFRNANSDIITTLLPKEFAGTHRACGDSVEENTNWRSDRRIVEFNNFFFHTLASRTMDVAGNAGGGAEVYGGTVQRASHRDDRGLVSVKFVAKADISEKNDRTDPEPYFSDFGPLVQEFLARGYRQRDIAFLVNTKNEGTQIIDSFVAFNSTLPEGAERIEFVSEESLLVSSSKTVATVIAALKAISEPRSVRLAGEEERVRKGLGSWENVGSHFHLYVMRHGGIPSQELLEKFEKILGTPEDPSLQLQERVASMQAHTLPALIEMAIGDFVSKEEAEREAPYLAALQDMVLEYSENNPADLPSFLAWWETTGTRRSITSPKDIDAVKVMTIHKSKGLQFKCTVVPGVSFSFSPSSNKQEWLWVRPDSSVGVIDGETVTLPPVVPVGSQELTSILKANPDFHHHRDTFEKYAHEYMMDILNKTYVAFTRAEEELHLYVPLSATKQEHLREDLLVMAGEKEIPEEEENELAETLGGMDEALSQLLLHTHEYVSESDEARREHMPTPEAEIKVELAPLPDPESELPQENGETGNGYRTTEIGRIEFGHPRTLAERQEDTDKKLAKELRKAGEAKTPSAGITGEDFHTEGGYPSGEFPASLRFRLPDTGMLSSEEDDTIYVDARTEGNIIHAVLERMDTAADLHSALTSLRVKGKIRTSAAVELEQRLKSMLSSPEAARWFGEGLRVLNERPILVSDKGHVRTKRPDRVVADEEGNVIVIDYKTGAPSKSHHRQVKEYIRLLSRLTDTKGHKTYKNVEGWLWYLETDKKERVC